MSGDRQQRIYTLWNHDEGFAKHEVVVNSDRFPEGTFKGGKLYQLLALAPLNAGRSHQPTQSAAISTSDFQRLAGADSPVQKRSGDPGPLTFDENGVPLHEQPEVDEESRFLFHPIEASAEQKAKKSGLQVSSMSVENYVSVR